jgi:hypothetical protein
MVLIDLLKKKLNRERGMNKRVLALDEKYWENFLLDFVFRWFFFLKKLGLTT